MNKRHDNSANDNALADIALQMVIKTGRTYRFQDDAAKGLGLALDAMFANSQLDPRAQIEALVRLGLLFESRHSAAPIADTIFTVLARNDHVLRVLHIAAGAKSRALRAGFARFVDETVERRAPVYGAKSPMGTVKASDFLDPGAAPPRRRSPTPKSSSNRRPITIG